MSASARATLKCDDYTVACMCPKGLELAPVLAMFDGPLHPALTDVDNSNAYQLGTMFGHNVVVVPLPKQTNTMAATKATNLLRDFPNIRFGLLVGIGGGVPGTSEEEDIRLGDIVVSAHKGRFGPVVQWDVGKRLPDGHFKATGQLRPPPDILSSFVTVLEARHRMKSDVLPGYLSLMFQDYPDMENDYAFPTTAKDVLFASTSGHQPGLKCENCDSAGVVKRELRKDHRPRVFYGTIGSGNAVIRDVALRDQLKADFDVLCVETEAAGLMDNFQCLVIRGIADYADSHKNNEWQNYAAATAAAYMKDLLKIIPPAEVREIPKAQQSVDLREFP